MATLDNKGEAFLNGLTPQQKKLSDDMKIWQQEARCVGSKLPGFTAERTNSAKKNLEQEKPAKLVCRMCPVRVECLDHALRMPEIGGIWGGLNDAERIALAKRLGIHYDRH